MNHRFLLKVLPTHDTDAQTNVTWLNDIGNGILNVDLSFHYWKIHKGSLTYNIIFFIFPRNSSIYFKTCKICVFLLSPSARKISPTKLLVFIPGTISNNSLSLCEDMLTYTTTPSSSLMSDSATAHVILVQHIKSLTHSRTQIPSRQKVRQQLAPEFRNMRLVSWLISDCFKILFQQSVQEMIFRKKPQNFI